MLDVLEESLSCILNAVNLASGTVCVGITPDAR
jgi:hypothetical protein